MLSVEAFNAVFPDTFLNNDDNSLILDWMGPNQILQPPSEEITEAIERAGDQQDVIVMKYEDKVRAHFIQYAKPLIQQSDIVEAARTLKEAQTHYEYPLQFLNSGSLIESTFERNFKALIKEALTFDILSDKMTEFYKEHRIHELDQILMDVYCALCDFGLARDMEKILANVLKQEVEDYVEDKFSLRWGESILAEYKQWAENSLEPAVQKLVGYGFGQNLVDIGDEAVTELRINELFDIVVDYPDSIPALNDLKSTLKSSHQRAHLVSVFQQSCQKRLLQGGANTVDIIAGYISTIRSFSILEPRGVLLSFVSKPIRRYLRERDDTIKIIVSGLLGDENSGVGELSEELKNSNKKEDLGVGVDDLMDMHWNPDPLDAPPDFMKGKDDIVSNFISLYDNREVFVKELVDIFAEQMIREDSVSDVMMKLELLKMRFGERELQTLDVMVRDITESKRLDKKIHEDTVRGKPILKKFHGNILSRLFWPKFKTQNLELPPVIKNQMELYSQRYGQVKPNRKLKWLPNLGTVKLEIQLEDRHVEVDATPEQAAIIAFFQDGPKSLQQVENAYSMSAAYARPIIMFWVQKGVLKQKGDVFIVREKEHELQGNEDEDGGDEEEVALIGAGVEESQSNVQSAEERAKEEMGLYWQYIQGMLTNLGATPLERIHSFLKMVVPKETPYTKGVEDLEQFLNLMVAENKLTVNGTSYNLCKD